MKKILIYILWLNHAQGMIDNHSFLKKTEQQPINKVVKFGTESDGSVLSILSNGTLYNAGEENGTPKIWKTFNSEQAEYCKGYWHRPEEGFWKVVVSPEGARALLALRGGGICVRDYFVQGAPGGIIYELDDIGSSDFALNDDGTYIAVANNTFNSLLQKMCHQITLYKVPKYLDLLQNNIEKYKLVSHDDKESTVGKLEFLAFDSKSEYLAVLNPSTIRLWQLNKNKQDKKVSASFNLNTPTKLSTLLFHPLDNKYLLVGAATGEIYLLDRVASSIVSTLKVHTLTLKSLIYDQKNKKLFSLGISQKPTHDIASEVSSWKDPLLMVEKLLKLKTKIYANNCYADIFIVTQN